MKKQFLLLLLLLAVSVTGYGQANISNYVFATGTDGSLALDANGNAIDMSSGTTQLIGASSLSGAGSGLVNLPFDFWYMGARNTQFSVSAFGWLGIGVSLASGNGWLGGNNRLAPLVVTTTSAGTVQAMGTSTTGQIHFKTFGTAPNRVMVIEYQNMTINATLGTGATNDATFQARLYESTGAIEFVYGQVQVSGSTAVFNAIGISSTTTIYQSVNQTTHTSSTTVSSTPTMATGTYAALNSSSDGSRRYYRYTPSTATAPSGLNFSAVTATTTTLNWTDNSTNEVGYAIYRSNDGGSTYNFVTLTAASAVTSAQTGLVPGTTYHWRVLAIRESYSTAISGSQATSATGEITSIGSGNWNDPAIWSGGAVPTASDNVTIADGHTVTLNVTTAVCYNLTVGQGTSGILTYQATPLASLVVGNNLTVAAGGAVNAGAGTLFTHTLAIGGNATALSSGNLVNNGTFDVNGTAGVIVTFFGSQDGSISGTGTTPDFFSIVVNKGTSQVAIMDATIPFTLNAPTTTANRLTITAGTFRISSATSITPYHSGQTICAANGRLWLNHASANVTQVNVGTATGAGSPTVTGELRIDNGTFGYGSGNNTLTFTSGSGVLRMSGGTLNMFGAVSFASNAATQFIMSGGNFNVDVQGANALAAGTAAFTIGSLTTVNWSGGNVTIVDPHSASAGTAWTATSGGSKTITGGTLRLGDGVSASTGGATANTSGFGFFSSMPVWNVVINTASSVNSRQVRLSSSTASVIQNNITINAGGYLFLGSGTTASILNIVGTLTNNGTVAGVEAGATGQSIGSLQFSGTTAQTIAGPGSYVNLFGLNISNTAGVSSSVTLNVRRVNLFSGSLNPANITIGNHTAATLESPIIQIGGGGAAVAAGSFTTAPTIDESEANLVLIYSTMNGAATMGAYNEIAAGSFTLSSFTVGDADGLTIPADRTITVSGTVTMTSGLINLSGNTFTIGIDQATPGTLTYTAGLFTNGTLKRWFPITGLPTTVGTGIGYFPIGTTTGINRQVQVAFSAATALNTGGTISASHTNTAGATTIGTFTDAGVDVSRRTNASWTLEAGDGMDANGTLVLAIRGDSTVFPGTIADLRLIRATDAVGTSVNGSGTGAAPVGNRNGLSVSDLTNTFHLGTSAANFGLLYIANTSGNWGDNATWNLGSTPGASDAVIINAGVTVTVAGTTTPYQAQSVTLNGTLNANANTLTISGQSASGITINTGATMNVGGGTVVIGPTGGGNRRLTVTGTLNLTSGNIEVNGNVSIGAAATFTQSGGDLKIDGNAANVAGSSVASGTHLFDISTSATASVVSCTAGTITIVDPPINTSTTSRAMSLGLTAGTTSSWFSGTHTVVIGDGVSTTPGESVTGFAIDGYPGSGRVALNHVTVNGGNGVGRFARNTLSTANGTFIYGTLTINADSEFRWIAAATGDNAIGGNVVNNGTLTIATSTVSFGPPADASAFAVSGAQTISGTGTFRNATSAPTASSLGFLVSNTNGVTFNANLTVSSAVTINTGCTMNIAADRSFSVGTNGLTNNGTLAVAAGGRFVQGMGSTLSGTGTYTIRRNAGNTSNLRYNMWSSPNAVSTLSNLGGTDWYEFNTASNAWSNSGLTGSTTMTVGKGYSSTGAGNVLFTGTFNNGNLTPTVDASGNGFNLVGNPYPSTLNARIFLDSNTNLNGTLYFWSQPNNSTLGNIGGDYASWTTLGGTAGSVGGATPDSNIGVAQGFFVKANSGTTIRFFNSMRSTNVGSNFRVGTAEKAWFNITNNQGLFNQILLGFTPDASDASDRMDAVKMKGNTDISFYSVLNNEHMSIQAMAPRGNTTRIVPVGFDVAAAGTYTLALDRTEALANEVDIFVKDLATGTLHNLRNQAYSFSVAQAGTHTNRLQIHFGPALSTSVADAAKGEQVRIYSAGQTLYMQGFAEGTVVEYFEVRDAAGRLVLNMSRPQASDLSNIELSVASGVYLARIVTNNGIKTERVYLSK